MWSSELQSIMKNLRSDGHAGLLKCKIVKLSLNELLYFKAAKMTYSENFSQYRLSDEKIKV